jgi:Ribbon-helix-helix protein, copG family.
MQMIRTQVSLTADQMRRLKAEARRRGVPIAEVVRDAVDRAVPTDPGDRRARFDRLLAAAGRFRSGTGDVSARHDEIAGEGEW